MNDGRFEQTLERLLQVDLSVGTEVFRDELLARCLAVLDTDTRAAASGPSVGLHAVELDDADLGLLAAAGDAASLEESSSLGDGGKAIGCLLGPNS